MIFNLFSKEKVTNHKNQIVSDPVVLKDIKRVVKAREKAVDKEFDKGYDLIEKYPRSVSVLGSARFKEGNKYYKHARSLTNRIVRELKYAVVTGGGPGIMEAANRGAFEADGVSIGFTIKLPKEQSDNPYLTDKVEFEYFFSRKTLIFFAAETYIYYPGGFGTMDELCEILTLIQTNKITKTPVILVGVDFWTPIMEVFKQKMLIENDTISPEDMNIFKITDNEDQIVQIVKNAPYRQDH